MFPVTSSSNNPSGFPLVERRTPRRRYEPLLPEFFPVKLLAGAIAVDFVAGCPLDCLHCHARRHPAREALLDTGVAIDTRVPPRKVLAWLRSMPSYLAGVQLRLGHDSDAGLAFDKYAELIELVDPGRSVVYRTHRPLGGRERRFFGRPRTNVLVELTATPRSGALRVTVDPMELVRSVAELEPRRLHWVLGPLAADSLHDAERVVDALPPGTRLTLRPLQAASLDAHAPEAARPMPAAELSALESRALARHLVVTDWSCRNGVAETGRGFYDVDRITGQRDLGRRAMDLVTCVSCPSRTRCHGRLDDQDLERRLSRELGTLGLTLAAPPERTGPRSFAVTVVEPTARGDETYLAHALGQPVSVALSTRERGRDDGELFCAVDPAVLRRWWAHGFLPVNELNQAAEHVLEDLRRRLGARLPGALQRAAPGLLAGNPAVSG